MSVKLAAEDDLSLVVAMLEVLPSATPVLRQSILDAVFSRRDRIPALLDAVEAKTFPARSHRVLTRCTPNWHG